MIALLVLASAVIVVLGGALLITRADLKLTRTERDEALSDVWDLTAADYEKGRRIAHLELSRDDACVEATKQRHLAQDMAAAATRQVDESARAVEGARALLKLAGLS